MESYGNYAAPPKKSNTGLIIGLVIGGIVLCCIAPIGLVAGGGFWLFNKGKDLIVCEMSFSRLWKATEAYARDHKGKMPHSATWMDDIRPYYQKVLANQQASGQKMPFGDMPAEGTFSCSTEGKPSGIAFNKTLDAKPLDSIKDRSQTVAYFETESPAPNLAQKYEALPEMSSPKILGKPRGWFIVDADGTVRSGKARFSEGFNGAPTAVPDPSPPPQS